MSLVFPKPSKKTRAMARAEAKMERRLRLAEVRHEVVVRCAGYCELCRLDRVRELHHILGGTGRRKKEERLDTLIGLCLTCHASIHSGDLRALHRLARWAHDQRFLAAATEAERRIRKQETRQ